MAALSGQLTDLKSADSATGARPCAEWPGGYRHCPFDKVLTGTGQSFDKPAIFLSSGSGNLKATYHSRQILGLL